MVGVVQRQDIAGGVVELLQSLEMVRYLDPENLVDYVELLGFRSLAALTGWWLERRQDALGVADSVLDRLRALLPRSKHYALGAEPGNAEIGRASCRERVCQYV